MAYPTFDLDQIKDDLGIPVGDTSHDDWLTRRLNGIWSSFRRYTGRHLCPLSSFVDDWSSPSFERRAASHPPGRAGNSIFLTQYPVKSIDEIVVSGSVVDATGIVFDPRTGEMRDCPASIHNAKVSYQAGYETVPDDLYEALIGILSTMYAGRKSQSAGAGGAAIDTINIQDVGLIKFKNGGYAFDASLMDYNNTDPVMGPYTMILDSYKDWRNKLGLAGLPIHTTVDNPLVANTERLVGGDR